MKRRITWIFLALLLSQGAAQVTCPEPPPPEEFAAPAPMVMPEDFRMALFENVWQAVSELYLHEDFNGVDWQAIGSEFGPYVLATENAWEVYALLEEMVDLLDDPFTRFVGPLEIEERAAQDPTYGGIGALLEGGHAEEEGEGLRILYVFPESPAEEAGLESRDLILMVEDDPCPQVEAIRGPEGTEVRLLVASPGEEPRELNVERQRITPRILPVVRRFEGQPEYGYLRLFSLSGEETITMTQEGLARLLEEGPLQGLVIDLRRTRLGAPAVMINLLGHFVEGEVGTLYSRVGDTPLEIAATELHEALGEVPLVILVDEGSEGTAEQLTAVLQAQGRAQVVGMHTSGETHGVRNFDFPDGSTLLLVVAGLMLPDGTRFERQGVLPDVEMAEDWIGYPEGADPYILEALELLRGQPQDQAEEDEEVEQGE
jgi:carboxyl-terminal processing protease